MRLDLDVVGITPTEQHLRGIAGRAADHSAAYEEIADDLRDLEGRVWQTEGAVLGARWRRLNPDWAAWKAKRFPGAGILEMDGRLRRSLTIDNAPWSVSQARSDGLLYGTRLGIAGVHQRGGTLTKDRPRRTVRIPRRQFLRVRQADRRRWVSVIGTRIVVGRGRPRGFGL